MTFQTQICTQLVFLISWNILQSYLLYILYFFIGYQTESFNNIFQYCWEKNYVDPRVTRRKRVCCNNDLLYKVYKKCAASYNCSLSEGRQSSTYCIHSCLCVSIWSLMPGTVRTMDPELGTTNTCTYRRDLAIVCGL